ncbi:MAG: RagB/SusD family nutrient uptake outer membrane protein [Bacteroidales bacterium]|nr:RagB/SusD family nutrient uptake outer membrane protein [Bacteroidales bacterium]
MMKKHSKYILPALGFCCLLFGACVSLEDKTEDAFGRETVLSDDELASKLLNNAYAPFLENVNYYNRAFTMPPLLASDDHYFTRPDWPTRAQIDKFTWDPTEVMYNLFWNAAYKSIASCNTFIDNYTDASDPDFIDNVLGQAYFLRALNYFNLVRYYGRVPKITDSKLSIEESQLIPQSEPDEIYALIVEDLLKAQNLKPKWEAADLGRPSKAAAMALLGKVYLYMASPGGLNKTEYYAESARIFKEIDVNRNDLGVGLLPNYQSLFFRSAEYSQEMVFEIGANGPGLIPVLNWVNGQVRPWIFEDSPLGVAEGWGWYVAELDLYNSYSNSDARKEVTFETMWIVDLDNGGAGPLDDTIYYWDLPNVPALTAVTSDNAKVVQDSTPHCGKWRWPVNCTPNDPRDDINVPVIRYADCLLMLAEAELEATGTTAAAYNAINEVRNRAGLPALAGLSTEQFRDSLRIERRRELAYEECHRWFDIVRWDIHRTLPSLVAKGVGDKKYFPIPQEAINKSGGVLVQNPNIP